jgi:hypothetical protein
MDRKLLNEIAYIRKMMDMDEGKVKSWGGGERIHVTDIPNLTIDKLRDLSNEQTATKRKPKGVWYGFGDEWLDFLHREGYWEYSRKKGEYDKYRYKLYVDTSNIAVINNLEEADRFHDEFKYEDPNHSGVQGINWPKVAQTYMGVEIPNFAALYTEKYDEMRNRWFNYSSWDLSSGCIWNPAAIKRIKLIGEFKPGHERGFTDDEAHDFIYNYYKKNP